MPRGPLGEKRPADVIGVAVISITQDRKERPRGSPRGIGCRRQIQNGLPDCAPLHTVVKNLWRARASARFRRQARRGA